MRRIILQRTSLLKMKVYDRAEYNAAAWLIGAAVLLAVLLVLSGVLSGREVWAVIKSGLGL